MLHIQKAAVLRPVNDLVQEYFSPESAPEKGTNLALNREFFSRGAVEKMKHSGGCVRQARQEDRLG